MSVNLTLVFDRFAHGSPILGYNRLALGYQDHELFDQIKADAVPLSGGMDWYDDDGLEVVSEDPYGAPLTCMSAFTLARHFASEELRGWDAAVLAFVKHLPPDARIVLWWH